MGRYSTRVEIDGVEDCPVTIDYVAHPFRAGETDGRYGPKIEPDEDAYIEIEKVTLDDDGREITLTDEQEARLEEEIGEWLMGRYDEDPPEEVA